MPHAALCSPRCQDAQAYSFEGSYASGEFLTGTVGFDTVNVGGLEVSGLFFQHFPLLFHINMALMINNGNARSQIKNSVS